MTAELAILKQIAKGIALEFGDDCEVVIHDMSVKNAAKSIIYIDNGYITGRSIGDGPLKVLQDMLTEQKEFPPNDRYAFLTTTRSGKTLKSTTLFIKNDKNILKYILCINYDITGILAVQSSINHLISFKENDKPAKLIKPDNNVSRLLDELIEQAMDTVGIPVALMTKEDKIRFINYLNDAGAFLITRSGDRVSEFLGISKYTLYNYVSINK